MKIKFKNVLILAVITTVLSTFCSSITTAQTDTSYFRFFKDSKIAGFNKKTLSNRSLDVCKKQCLKYEWCKSFDYNPKSRKCYLQDVNARDVGALTPDEKLNYYELVYCDEKDIYKSYCFQQFKSSKITGFNKKTYSDLSLDDCKRECFKHDWCKSIDWELNTKKCYLQNADVEDVGKLTTDEKYEHYRRICW